MMSFLAYVVLTIFVVAERLLRRDDAARSLEADEADRGTTMLIGASFGTAVTGGLLVAILRRGRTASRPARRWLGLAAMITGLLLRVWAARTLGRFYTRTLKVRPDQTVVQSGPYRVIRHPGYLADLVLWLGFGQAIGSRLLTALIGVMMGIAYTRRIDAEETLLLDRLGQAYADYKQTTWRLLPLIY
jgi:protein-S-isoprenylcysteine O-methyltransferase Ste14